MNKKSVKGISNKFTVRECPMCKNKLVLHSFADTCKSCKKVKARSLKTINGVKNPFLIEDLVWVSPSSQIKAEGKGKLGLIEELNSKFGLPVHKRNFFCRPESSILFKGKEVKYYSYKGSYTMLKSDYSKELCEEIFLSKISKQRTNKPRAKKEYSTNLLDKISKILTLRNNKKLTPLEISTKINMSRSWCSQVLTGRIYSDLTNIKFKRAFNTYAEDGVTILISKERVKNNYSSKAKSKEIHQTKGTTC